MITVTHTRKQWIAAHEVDSRLVILVNTIANEMRITTIYNPSLIPKKPSGELALLARPDVGVTDRELPGDGEQVAGEVGTGEMGEEPGEWTTVLVPFNVVEVGS